jgi:hypothetical protein
MVVADGSKFGDVAMSTVAPIERVSVIVTDPSADAAEVERIEGGGVEVVMVPPDSPADHASVETAGVDGATAQEAR